MRRLYIGGLSHTVTEKDLKDRFGKFGNVEDVELRTRVDEEGVPFKTFGYINISISDADLKKCMTVLNKSKWKGGILQIEPAKESFLHKLAQERREAAEQQLQQPADDDKRKKLLHSMNKAGVDNFTMKAAVPGTEVPGHKDWVVSKFGRVLPVLQLRCQKGSKTRTLKYNPSKYSHNIRRLNLNDVVETTPVTHLTWEVQGGDNDISKKRRGEFPPFEPSRLKKSRTDEVNSSSTAGRTRFDQTVNSMRHTESHQFADGFGLPTNHTPAQRKRHHWTNSDIDSDEEIRQLVAAQLTSQDALQQEEDDNLEVVGHDYTVKSGQKGEDEDEYDSADTDELFASRNPSPKTKEILNSTTTEHSGNVKNNKKMMKKKSKAAEKKEEEEDSTDAEEHFSNRKPPSVGQKQNQKTAAVLKLSSSESNGDDDESDSSDSCLDSDFEAMFSNVTHLEISLADLQKLAEDAEQTSKTTPPSTLGSDPAERPAPKKGTTPEEILAVIMGDNSSEDEVKRKKKTKPATSTPLPAFKGTKTLDDPSEEGEDKKCLKDEDEQRGVKKQKLNITPQIKESKSNSVKGQKHGETQKKTDCREEKDDDDVEEEEDEEVVEIMASSKVLKISSSKVPVSPEESETSSSSSSEDEEGVKTSPGVSAAIYLSSSFEEQSESSSTEEEDNKDNQHASPWEKLGAEEEEERQRKDNMRRLAAVQQRQKEAEEHKKVIQGALANLDAPTKGTGKHIVFGSDDDDEEEEDDGGGDDDEEEEDGGGDDDDDKPQTNSKLSTSKKNLVQDSQSEDEATDDEAAASESVTIKKKIRQKSLGPWLFGGSEDEDDGSGDEDESSRFEIKPQFEGRAGQKLMELQSRFGTDERFRMDSRFLEDEEDEDEKEEETDTKGNLQDEEDLEEEKKKTLSILQSVLGRPPSSTTGSKAKFRDVSALHYDPSREDHAVFETKKSETKEESKAARKKKRQEAQKLPEVSKEIYYEVSGNLKTVFGQSKDETTEEERKTNWDQMEEGGDEQEEKEEKLAPQKFLFSAGPETREDDSSGFKFSFFGDDNDAGTKETAEYKVESIQAPKVSWQQDPRFHDSSSGEDEDEQEEAEEEQSNATDKATDAQEVETPSNTELFFFQSGDSRLKEGPRWFCCDESQLEDQKEAWEERRAALRKEYRKKHRDAKRRATFSMKR
ncbi:nucleolar protein 8 isoform 1-T5 [Pholidichthys leucotaenia]